VNAADQLRQAAATLRERAGAATPGPWGSWGQHIVKDTGRHTCGTGPDGHFGAHEPGCGLDDLGQTATEDAAYIATVHPAVGLALADWLDATARTGELVDAALTDCGDPPLNWEYGDMGKALAVARAVNGADQ
jgi:hypothetical protein